MCIGSAKSSMTSPRSSTTRVDNSWNVQRLLKLSDSIREQLANGKASGPEFEELPLLLQGLVAAEARKNPTITFETIREASLDKLLEEIQDEAKGSSTVPPTFQGIVHMANELQRY